MQDSTSSLLCFINICILINVNFNVRIQRYLPSLLASCLQVLDSEDQLCHHLFTVHKTESCHCHCHYPYEDIAIAVSNIPTAQVAGALKCIARVANY